MPMPRLIIHHKQQIYKKISAKIFGFGLKQMPGVLPDCLEVTVNVPSLNAVSTS